MKYQPEHFPRGAVVEYCVFGKDVKQVTVDHLVQNGIRSYCIISTDRDPKLDKRYTFNISHVTKIVSRGNGQVIIKEFDYGFPTVAVCQTAEVHKAKNRYQSYFGIDEFARYLIDQFMSKSGTVDMDKFREYIYSPINPLGIKRRGVSNDNSFGIVSISKKKLKKFLKQNINRFLIKQDVAQKIEEEMYDEIYERDFEIETTPLEELFPKKVYTPESLMSSHQAERCVESGKAYKGVLTTEEAQQQFHESGNRKVVAFTAGGFDDHYFFFSDDHCFGTHVLPEDFVPCTSYLPYNVVPRKGVEDGILDTFEKYMVVHCQGKKQINSIQELCEYLNTRPAIQAIQGSYYSGEGDEFDPHFNGYHD